MTIPFHMSWRTEEGSITQGRNVGYERVENVHMLQSRAIYLGCISCITAGSCGKWYPQTERMSGLRCKKTSHPFTSLGNISIPILNHLPQILRISQSGEIPAVKVGRKWDFSKQYFHDAGFLVTE